mmetsp:Transcript_20170/g.26006  ORF Transcript_20170/g.26006 Transcript_20170/m.26006 type:complete len:127 (+) Transcript_20170:119-499(+)
MFFNQEWQVAKPANPPPTIAKLATSSEGASDTASEFPAKFLRNNVLWFINGRCQMVLALVTNAMQKGDLVVSRSNIIKRPIVEIDDGTIHLCQFTKQEFSRTKEDGILVINCSTLSKNCGRQQTSP